MDNLDKLPSWASYDEQEGHIVIDPDIAYPYYIEQTGLVPDKFGAEVARRCAINDLIEICGQVLVFISKSEAWKLVNLPGDPSDAQRGANEFNDYYDALVKKRARAALIGKVI